MSSLQKYLYLLIVIFINLFIAASSFVPLGRCFHSSVLIGTQLYFLGGIDSDEIFYLDVSLPFDSKKLLWTNLTTNASIPINSAFETSCVGGQNNKTIFLFGHHKKDNDKLKYTITYTFDTINQEWSIPTIINPDQIPPVKQNINAACDLNGKMYIFGGYNPNFHKFDNDMYVLDSLKLSWQYIASSSIIQPTVRSGYTATLLPNSFIVYIGGTNGDSKCKEIDMNDISIFDTNSGTWTSMVYKTFWYLYLSDGLIVIYGGTSNNNSEVPKPSLAVLDTKPEIYKWHRAEFSGEKFDEENNLNINVYILDTKSFLWVTSASHNASSTMFSSATPSKALIPSRTIKPSRKTPSRTIKPSRKTPSNTIIPSRTTPSSTTHSNVTPSSIIPSNVTSSNAIPSNAIPSNTASLTNSTSVDNTPNMKIVAGLSSTAGATILFVACYFIYQKFK
ncbi:16957_t:CDS:2 [Dentiscutata erythropus]|uniref:16957_t:CDS:1 n=1 Tax=Dentiscutata erythropus TaxID=1348616 RepID=A0A9N9B8D8_9GLOM|nr:16957_t:CDS:2 [Dentiscutata erythropus]